ncbi:Pseudouridine synthase, RsuA/RluB/C/D/E/F [Sesbania bispinosa]|nr:Pseudouridine synthase, RsuA/RluB/C/D/E/F [Sesbania bispinosa]
MAKCHDVGSVGMLNPMSNKSSCSGLFFVVRHYSRIRPPKPVSVEPVIRVSNNIARLDVPKEGPKPRQLLSLPPFPGHLLPAKKSISAPGQHDRVTAVNWIKYYFKGTWGSVIESHFREGLVQMEHLIADDSLTEKEELMKRMRKIRPNEVMKHGARVHVPVSMAETRISKRYDAIPSGTLYPNADEIKYLQRLVIYKDSAIIVLNKPPKLPVKGNLPVHNSMDALAAAALSYDYDEGPKLVHRLDRETSGIILLGRTKDSVSHLQWLFSNINNAKSSCKAWNDACEATYQRYWALVIGTPKEKEGIIHAPLSKVLLNDGKTERVILAHNSSIEPQQEAVTEYRVLGPKINGCSWVELRPITYRKHQLRVHCAEALGTPIVGDYKYGWFVHSRWKQMPRVDIEPTTGNHLSCGGPEGLEVQKGSVLSKGKGMKKPSPPNNAKSCNLRLARVDRIFNVMAGNISGPSGSKAANILLNHDFSDGLNSWHLNCCNGYVISAEAGTQGEISMESGGNYAVITDRKECWQGLEQDITNRISIGSTYMVTACVGVSGIFRDLLIVLATLKLEYHDSATRVLVHWKNFCYKGPLAQDVFSTGDDIIIINPQFEDGLNNWSGRGCKIMLHDSMGDGKIVPKSGKYFASATERTQSWNGIQQEITGRVQRKLAYEITALVRIFGNNVTNADVRATLWVQTPDLREQYIGIAKATDKDWVTMQGKFLLNGSPSKVVLYLEGPPPGTDILVNTLVVKHAAKTSLNTTDVKNVSFGVNIMRTQSV